ncbi:MAG: hypothetical protein [Podoviridae sp. ctrTa16]|nr:MAG: hypothetical protein [Podoviridae sp. ctrTa16]
MGKIHISKKFKHVDFRHNLSFLCRFYVDSHARSVGIIPPFYDIDPHKEITFQTSRWGCSWSVLARFFGVFLPPTCRLLVQVLLPGLINTADIYRDGVPVLLQLPLPLPEQITGKQKVNL